jgi:hypothetical protein
MEELESVQVELASREDTLIKQEDLYIASKEALALDRSEVETLCKALAKEQQAHAITKKAHIALKQKYCDLDGKHKEHEEQYSILWDSNSHPSKANDASTPSTSQCCEKCYNLDLNIYSTNLANMEAMRKEIARFNGIIAKGCIYGKTQNGDKKVEEPKRPRYKNERHLSIKDGLGHTKGAKTNGRKLVNGVKCVQFERKEHIGIV